MRGIIFLFAEMLVAIVYRSVVNTLCIHLIVTAGGGKGWRALSVRCLKLSNAGCRVVHLHLKWQWRRM